MIKLTYIYHSCFTIETDNVVLVFDYWKDPSQAIPQILTTEKKVYVFSSHFHEDHFNRDILSWHYGKDNSKSPTFILSKDILRHRRTTKEKANVWLGTGGTWNDDLIKVYATPSTDYGVSWIIESNGISVFHAGDLNNWCITDDKKPKDFDVEKEEKQYLGALKTIKKTTNHFDIAMFPIDARIGNFYMLGGKQFVERFSVGLFAPMHFSASGFESAWEFEKFTITRQTTFWRIEREGDSIII